MTRTGKRRNGNRRPGHGHSGRWRGGTPPPELCVTGIDHDYGLFTGLHRGYWNLDAVHQRVQWLCEPYSYRAVAEVTGLNAETVRRMIRGQSISIELLAEICMAGNVSPAWILFGFLPVWLEDPGAQSVVLRASPTSLLVIELAKRLGRLDELDRTGFREPKNDPLHEPIPFRAPIRAVEVPLHIRPALEASHRERAPG